MRWTRPAERALGTKESATLDLALRGGMLEARLTAGEVDLSEARGVDLEAARLLAAEMASILNRATRWPDPDQGSRELLRQRGEVLLDVLLPPMVKAALRRLGGGPLELVLDEALLGLPWELMHTGTGFIGLELAVGRIARGLQPAGAGRRAAARTPLRTLIVCDPKGDLIGSYYEGLTLRDELAAQPERFAVDLRSSEVGLADVRKLLREYDVVHFAGHVEPGRHPERGWWLRDGVLGPAQIRELAGGRPFPRMVFSNACRSAGEGVSGAPDASELVAAFLEAGVEHYIGTVHDVPDEPASLFALTFYEALMARPRAGIGEAVRVARARLAERYGGNSVFWAAWVLYGEPAESRDATTRPTPRIDVRSAARPALELPALGAQVRGASSTRSAAVIVEAPSWWRWPYDFRASAIGLGLLGVVVATIALSAVHGLPTQTQWIEARAPGRMGALSREPAALVPNEGTSAAALGIGLIRAQGTASAPYVLATGERFRLRMFVPRAGWVALIRVASSGATRSIDPAGGAVGELREIPTGGAVEVPSEGRWMTLEGSGTERFLLAWRQVPPSEPRAFAEELGRALAEASGSGVEAGMERLARVSEALEDRFDAVSELVVEQR